MITKQGFLRNFFYTIALPITLFATSCGNDNNQKTIALDSNNVYTFPEIAPYTDSIVQYPANAEYYFKRGSVLEQMNYDSLALVDFFQATRRDSTKAKYFSAIGNLEVKNKNISGSVAWFQKAISIDPKEPLAHLTLARVFLMAQDFRNAFKEINLVLRDDVYNPEAYFLKGMVYKQMKDTSLAISSFLTAIQVDPEYKDAMFQLAKLYEAKNDPAAFQIYENAYLVDTTDILPLYAKGMAYQNADKPEDAKKVYERIILNDPQYSDAYFNTGYILMHQDSLEKAKRMFERVTKIEVDHAGAYYNKGVCNELLGNKAEALEDYQQALVFNPNYQEASEGIKRLNKK